MAFQRIQLSERGREHLPHHVVISHGEGRLDGVRFVERKHWLEQNEAARGEYDIAVTGTAGGAFAYRYYFGDLNTAMLFKLRFG